MPAKTRALLTPQVLADYLGINPSSLSIAKSGADEREYFAGLPAAVLTLGGRELRDAAAVKKWAPEWIAGSRRNAKRELNLAELERAVRLPVDTTIVSTQEIGRVFGIDSRVVVRRPDRLPEPLAEFDTARTPPAYDLDAVLEKNAAARKPWPADEAVIAELRKTNTLTAA